MKFLNKVKWREAFAAVRKIDNGGLRRKRIQLRKRAKDILKRKSSIARRIDRVRVLEADFRDQRREYEILVNSITRQLSYTEPKTFQDRQKALNEIISSQEFKIQEIEIEV